MLLFDPTRICSGLMKQVHVRAITRQPRQVLRVVTWFPVAFCVAQGSHGTTILSHVLTLYV